MNRLDTKTRIRVVSALVEGCSLRSTCRMTGVAMGTGLKLLTELGAACDDYQDRAIFGLKTKRLQCDEIWSFCYAKDRNVPERMKGDPGVGSVWTWTALDADSKLIITWYIGSREAECANRFMIDAASRIDGRVQLTTDGLNAYRYATVLAFEQGTVDYAQLVKIYAGVASGGPEARYSPPVCCGVKVDVREGSPDPDHVSTSFVERQNLTMRMSMRRFTRLTNGHSKKLHNHQMATALHFMHYNFCRVHSTLRTTPSRGSRHLRPRLDASGADRALAVEAHGPRPEDRSAAGIRKAVSCWLHGRMKLKHYPLS